MWRSRSPREFAWQADELPRELDRLLESGALPPGAALDVGCGAGAAARRISRSVEATVGLDVAMAAVGRARDLARREGAPVRFVVGEAPELPFADGSFALIFDRGCLQNVPRSRWPAYFERIERLLAPGGFFQLFVIRPALPPALSVAGAKARLRHPRRALGTRKRAARLDGRLRGHVPPSLEVVEVTDVPVLHGTRRRTFVHLLARKAGGGRTRPARI